MHYEYVYKTNKFESKRHRRTKRSFKGIVFLVGLVILGYYLSGFTLQILRNKNTVTIASPLAEPVTASIDTIKGAVAPKSLLPKIVSDSLSGTTGTYAVVIKNLSTGESYQLNETRKFDSASLYKLWVMATTYQIMETGKLDPEVILDRSIPELNEKFDIASESAELTEGQFTMSVKNALHQMITISHNYAALALSEKIGLSNVTKFLKNNSLSNSRIGGDLPQTTASDIALFYEKLYAGKLGSKGSTASMLELLKKQQLNDRIPKYLPEGLEVAHKTGELGAVKHDTGIVFTPKGDYIIVLLSETNSQTAAAERQALLSKAVFEYFQNKEL
ncbi:MAG: serine hydrolase [Candidatus Levybacteria bacterium]|nr:serine hydrolase [Candidatus Levybacteria bacterium]